MAWSSLASTGTTGHGHRGSGSGQSQYGLSTGACADRPASGGWHRAGYCVLADGTAARQVLGDRDDRDQETRGSTTPAKIVPATR
ncbi:hypothetical protein ABTE28_19810, partial [Acinetobacter baumannii]